MSKNKKIVRYRRPFQLNIGLIIFGIIFFYIIYYIYSYFTVPHTSVYEVIHGTIAVNNTFTGLALRSEELVTADYPGNINYYLKDGVKTGVGDLIYSIDADGAIARQIDTANEDASSLDKESLYELEKEISEYTNTYRPQTFYQVYTFKNDLNAQLAETLSMKALNSISDVVTAAEGNATFHKGTAAKDGIVVYYVDGFEGVTKENFTKDMFDESSYSKKNLKEQVTVAQGDPVYKLITEEDWDLIIPIAQNIKNQLKNSSTVRIRFQKDGTVARVPFTIVEKDEASYLILSFSTSMIRFATDRYVEVELLFDEEKGLKIPNSAIVTKDFFTVPMEYFQKGNNSSQEGIIVRKTDKNGRQTDTFVTPDIYFATEYSFYVDGEELSDGDVLLKPNSSETYTIHETAKLEGIYCINKGYAVFRQIDVMYQNEEYSIIRSGTDYGISLYDHIALEGSTITENDIINK